MAKGKEAVAAARRRYEASVEHIDRMTSELADAKMRAKATEAAASKVPALEEQIRRLRHQLDTEDTKQRQRADDLAEELRSLREEQTAHVEVLRSAYRVALKTGTMQGEKTNDIAKALGFATSRHLTQYLLYRSTSFAEHEPSFAGQVRRASRAARSNKTFFHRAEGALGYLVEYLENPTEATGQTAREMMEWALDDNAGEDPPAWSQREIMARATERHQLSLKGQLPSRGFDG